MNEILEAIQFMTDDDLDTLEANIRAEIVGRHIESELNDDSTDFAVSADS